MRRKVCHSHLFLPFHPLHQDQEKQQRIKDAMESRKRSSRLVSIEQERLDLERRERERVELLKREREDRIARGKEQEEENVSLLWC